MWRFVKGLAAGVAGGCGLILVGAIGLAVAHGALLSDPARTAEAPVRLAGAEATRLGGARIELESGTGAVHQDCRGMCDDLDNIGAVRSVRVFDAVGRCVFCRRTGRFSGKDLVAAPLLGGARE